MDPKNKTASVDPAHLEKYSCAATLSDMEIFVFPELLFSLVLFEPRPKAICVALGVWADETRDRMGPIEAALGSLRPAPGG